VDQLRFDGKVAIITGAGRGIGAAYARMLGGRGCRVLVNDIGIGVTGEVANDAPAKEVVDEITAAGGTAVADTHDVISESEDIIAHALDQFGALDIVINNAGITGGGPFAKLSADRWSKLFDTHFHGTVNVSRAAWPHLLASGSGRLVNTASPAIFGAPFISHYASAKAATMTFSKVLAAEGARKGVNVNAVAPSASTRMTSFVPGALADYVDEFFPPAEVASFVAWLVHESNTISGETFIVGGGAARRVVLAVSRGARVPNDSGPEAWATMTDSLLGLDALDVPNDLLAEMRRHAERLGGPALSAYERIAGPDFTSIASTS
jgi:NAD(P)-dependent dehydrogenase (short-subunit alcohol dehydrogenase family)